MKGKNFMDEKNVTQIAANGTVDGAETSPGSSFSSIENTRRSLMDVTNNLSDDEININNEILKSMFLNILERLDNSEILLDSLRNKLDAANQEIDFLKEKYKNMKKYIISKREFDELNDKIFDMDCRIIQTEQYSCRESILISGIPENISQNHLETTVLKILRSIGLRSISSYEITACHRLGKKKLDKSPAKTIVRFTNRKAVEFCLKNRDWLLEMKPLLKMNLRFYESLCTANEETLRDCIKLKRNGLIKEYYIRNGFIKIIKIEGDKSIKIYHPDSLYEHFVDFYDNDILGRIALRCYFVYLLLHYLLLLTKLIALVSPGL